MSPPWKRPAGWSDLAAKIAWHDWRSRLDFDICDDKSSVVLSVIDWSTLADIRERLDEGEPQPFGEDASVEDWHTALSQIGAVQPDVHEREYLRNSEGRSPQATWWAWPDAETAMRAWRAVGGIVDEKPTGLIEAARRLSAEAFSLVHRDWHLDFVPSDLDALRDAQRALQVEIDRIDLRDAGALP